MTRILEARDLYRFYHAGDEETLALRGVSVTAEPGELIAVVGPSGSGKSTLLACIAGLDEPDGGVVDVAGERVSRRSESGAHGDPRSFDRDALPEWQPARPPQRRGQRPARTTARRPRRHRRRQCDPESVGLGARAHALPAQLSGGELARAGLAVALANDPPLLLADEPTGELDSDTADLIVSLLRQRSGAGCAVVAATHNRRLADAAHRTVELADGRVVP